MEICSVCSWRWDMSQKCFRYFYPLWWASCRIWIREMEFLVPTTVPTWRRLFSTKVENVHSRFRAWNKHYGTKSGILGIIIQLHYNTATTNTVHPPICHTPICQEIFRPWKSDKLETYVFTYVFKILHFPDLSTKPDLSTVVLAMKKWQIGGCTLYIIFNYFVHNCVSKTWNILIPLKT